MIASVWDIAAEHVVTFLLGLVVGFVLTDRYRLVRRNGSSPESDDAITKR